MKMSTLMTGRQVLIPLITNSLKDEMWEKQHLPPVNKSIPYEEEEGDGKRMTNMFADHDPDSDGQRKLKEVPPRDIVLMESESSSPSIMLSSLPNSECSSCMEKERELRELSSQLNRMKMNLVRTETDPFYRTNESTRAKWEHQEHNQGYQMTDNRLTELGQEVSHLRDQNCRLVGFLTGAVCGREEGGKKGEMDGRS
jgi:hypothetical protein